MEANIEKTDDSFIVNLTKWLEKRKIAIETEIENTTDKDVKIKKGCKLRGIKECLAYVKSH